MKPLAPVILAVTVLAGCGGGKLTSPTSASTGSTARLVLGAGSLNFGSVSVGSSKTGTLTLSNISNSLNITINGVSVSGADFSLNPPPSMPLVLTQGHTVTLTLKFAPQSSGSQSGSLSITSDASDPDPIVPLSGAGLAASGQLEVVPSTISFGNVAVGNSVTQNGSLTASGASITVSSAAWSGQGYSISGISFPVTINAGESVPFTVTFVPPIAGALDGSISFVSNATNAPSETLAGTGIQQEQQHSVTLSWQPSASQVLGYNIYRGVQPGGPYPTKLNSSPQSNTSFTDGTVQSGDTYFYVATAISMENVESGPSNETEAIIP